MLEVLMSRRIIVVEDRQIEAFLVELIVLGLLLETVFQGHHELEVRRTEIIHLHVSLQVQVTDEVGQIELPQSSETFQMHKWLLTSREVDVRDNVILRENPDRSVANFDDLKLFQGKPLFVVNLRVDDQVFIVFSDAAVLCKVKVKVKLCFLQHRYKFADG